VQILMTGGTGLIGSPAIAALLRRSANVRLYSRSASQTISTWPQGVTAIDGDIADAEALERAMQGCQVVLHLAGAVTERDGASFEAVNVEGTRHAVAAASSAGVSRFVYVSSLGAERGKSPYHESKRRAEEVARGFSGEWVVLRPGNIYGPGDDVISILLKMVRVAPAVPAINGGAQEFEPMWVEDFAEVLARSIDHPGIAGRCIDLAGPERTSMNDLIGRLSKLTDRAPARLATPGALAVLGARVAHLLGMRAPLDAGQITMLEEGNCLTTADNPLETVFGVSPTKLDEGLKRLADTTPEQRIDEGYGSLIRRHVWVDIEGSSLAADALFEQFRSRFSEMTPLHVEVGVEPSSDVELRFGGTLTMHLPLRGNVQVRVVELERDRLTLATLDGHPLAGVVNFRVEDHGPHGLSFHVDVHDRPSTIVDWFAMSTVGGALQLATWRATLEHVVEASGGKAPDGVKDDTERVEGAERDRIEAWADSLIENRQRLLHDQARSEASSSLRGG
jgi:uncharacterized protein YbjT (DUF2867 family)